jgi:hypothetical protein
MTKVKSKTQQWMDDHPDDTPPPKTPAAALAWRNRRFSPRAIAERAKYEAALLSAATRSIGRKADGHH